MAPSPAVVPLERALYVPDAQTLVCADLHLGKALESSVDVPLDDGGDVLGRLENLLACETITPQTVVIAGDVLDSFTRVPRQVRTELRELEEVVVAAGASLVVTRGNHDRQLATVYDGTLVDEYRLADGETVVCHGHERPTQDATRYIIGHDHPAITLNGRKRPCVLYGPGVAAGGDVIVLPAFTRLARGTTINRRTGVDLQSPLVTDLEQFHPAVWDAGSQEALWFPPLHACRSLL